MNGQELLFYSLAMGSAGCLGLIAFPALTGFWTAAASRIEKLQRFRVDTTRRVLDDLFLEVESRWLKIAYTVVPLTIGLLVFLLTTHLVFALIGMALGLLVPDLWIRVTRVVRRSRFSAQLVDALFILSSSLRAGLSLMQAFEQLESEMVPPASQEFGLMMKGHRLGLTLEEALHRLNERMPSDELRLITTAVLVARETGGDVTTIISQLITTIRERKRLHEKVKTLTLQGKLQAYIMSCLPFLFAIAMHSMNPEYLQLLLDEPKGQLILLIAVGLWIVGITLLMRLSKVDI